MIHTFKYLSASPVSLLQAYVSACIFCNVALTSFLYTCLLINNRSTMALTEVSSNKMFGGYQKVFSHER